MCVAVVGVSLDPVTQRRFFAIYDATAIAGHGAGDGRIFKHARRVFGMQHASLTLHG